MGGTFDLSSDSDFSAARGAHRAKRPEAVELFTRLMRKAELAQGRRSLSFAYLLEFRGRAKTRQGDADGLSDVRAARQLAIDVDDPFLPPAGVLESEARCLLELGRLADAADCFRRAAEEYNASGLELESGTAAWRGALALRTLGRRHEADHLLRLALERTASDVEVHETIVESLDDRNGR